MVSEPYSNVELDVPYPSQTGKPYKATSINRTMATMRKFDRSCLTQIHEFSPHEIKALRERERVSQPIFANCLNLSKEIISQWERGLKKPSGASLKLLSLIEKKGLEAIL